MAWLQTIGKGKEANRRENSSIIRQTTTKKNIKGAPITNVCTEPNEPVLTQFGKNMRTTTSTTEQRNGMEIGGGDEQEKAFQQIEKEKTNHGDQTFPKEATFKDNL